METVFFADDEQAIRDGLKVIINWEALGFHIVGDAANGEDALQQILALRPSLCILDIRMPKMHGLEVIKILRAQGYNGRIIILSGYSDFKYAKQAIRYNVTDYLTKPIDEEELQRIVTQLYAEIAKENTNTKVLSHYRAKARREILEDLMMGTADISLLDLSELGLVSDVYQVVIYEEFRGGESMPYQLADMLNMGTSGNSSLDHFVTGGKNVLLLKGDFALSRFNHFVSHYKTTPPQKNSPMDTFFFAYGSPVNTLSSLPLSYNQAKKLLSRRFFCERGQHTLGYTDLPAFDSSIETLNPARMDYFCDIITDYIQAYNRKMITASLEEVTAYLSEVSDEVTSIYLFLTDLFLRIKENIRHNYATMEIPVPGNTEIIEIIKSKCYLYEIIEYLDEQFELIMNSIGNSNRDSILDDILYYIAHNYWNNLKLESIAPLFGYNAAYLGKIFSKTVGENFNNYVDHIRINAAKALIVENRLKIYEIAEKVGYRNVDYFHKKFKKYVHVSPAEYRKTVLEEQGLSDDGSFDE